MMIRRGLVQLWSFSVIVILFVHPDAMGSEKIRVKLKWTHQAQFAGFYAAIERGLYRKAGLDVELIESTSDDDVVEHVLAGKSDFGVSDSGLVIHRLQGSPVVALAALFQHSPQVIMCTEASGIEHVHDLAGRTLMLEPDCHALLAYLADERVSLELCTRVPHSHSTDDMVDGAVDAMSAYTTDETFQFDTLGIPVRTFTPRSAGIDFYEDIIFTSEVLLRDRPEIVPVFLDATKEGWSYALTHPNEMIDLMHNKYGVQRSSDQLAYELERMERYIAADVVDVGHMSAGRWHRIAEIYAGLGLVPMGDFALLKGFLYPIPLPDHVGPLVSAAYATFVLLAILFFIGMAHISHYIASRRGVERRYGVSQGDCS